MIERKRQRTASSCSLICCCRSFLLFLERTSSKSSLFSFPSSICPSGRSSMITTPKNFELKTMCKICKMRTQTLLQTETALLHLKFSCSVNNFRSMNKIVLCTYGLWQQQKHDNFESHYLQTFPTAQLQCWFLVLDTKREVSPALLMSTPASPSLQASRRPKSPVWVPGSCEIYCYIC